MTNASKRIAVVPGDGIGPEVVDEAVGVLERLRETHGVALEFDDDTHAVAVGFIAQITDAFELLLVDEFGDALDQNMS